MSGADVEAIIAALAQSANYRDVAPVLLRRVAASEASKAARLSDAVARAKRKLHQLVGAYIGAHVRFERWAETLERASSDDERRPALRAILAQHASTRERLGEMAAIFAAMFAGLPSPRRVIDVACGLNPLARPFMPLAPDAEYVASDAHGRLVAFVARAMAALGTPGRAVLEDMSDADLGGADIVLLLKALPSLDQIDRDAAASLMARVDAPCVIVTFPTASLSGRKRAMGAAHRARFLAIAPTDRYTVEELEFRSELMFRLLRK
jgi:16S rRNA (guanine(1405)-N(7))-methyltransferase